MLPNFLLVGAEKSGTTTLAAMLANHPHVFMCEPKEPAYFTHNWERGYAWYASLFDEAEGYPAVGEASPAYTWSPDTIEAPQRIHDCLGDIKYLYIVRHPVKRMISHYRHALYHHWIPDDTSFEASWSLLPAIKNCSRYHYQVEQYTPFTQPEQWHIIVLEELIQNPTDVANGVFRFLAVAEQPTVDLPTTNVMDGKRRQPKALQRLGWAREHLPRPIIEWGKNIARQVGKKIETPDIPQAVQDRLLDELRPEINTFANFCGKNLNELWNIA